MMDQFFDVGLDFDDNAMKRFESRADEIVVPEYSYESYDHVSAWDVPAQTCFDGTGMKLEGLDAAQNTCDFKILEVATDFSLSYGSSAPRCSTCLFEVPCGCSSGASPNTSQPPSPTFSASESCLVQSDKLSSQPIDESSQSVSNCSSPVSSPSITQYCNSASASPISSPFSVPNHAINLQVNGSAFDFDGQSYSEDFTPSTEIHFFPEDGTIQIVDHGAEEHSESSESYVSSVPSSSYGYPVDYESRTRMVGAYTWEQRQLRIQKYLEKKKRRNFDRKVSYDCRKRVADSRLRIKGRFVRKEEANAILATLIQTPVPSGAGVYPSSTSPVSSAPGTPAGSGLFSQPSF
eukprot:GILI01001990.1.p1 GENE.GILI01001990.1~~GILI01001990.1.p1  ORF type:complete len:389 (+),score=74.96 GILI01001990.1:121-1167(+)